MAEINKVVAHLLDGRRIKGTTQDFFPNRATFHIQPTDGKPATEVLVSEMKALFFVRDLAGNRQYKAVRGFSRGTVPEAQGKKIAVHFKDGELLCAVPGFIAYTDDGTFPEGGLIADHAGNLYGVTQGGGTSGAGEVFKFNLATNTLSVLASFNGTNVTFPQGGLIANLPAAFSRPPPKKSPLDHTGAPAPRGLPPELPAAAVACLSVAGRVASLRVPAVRHASRMRHPRAPWALPRLFSERSRSEMRPKPTPVLAIVALAALSAWPGASRATAAAAADSVATPPASSASKPAATPTRPAAKSTAVPDFCSIGLPSRRSTK